MSDTELKSCPFCGKPAQKKIEWLGENLYGCGITQCPAYELKTTREKWNQRTTQGEQHV